MANDNIQANSEKKVVIELDNVRRNFLVGEETVHALKGVSFKIYEGEFVTIMGKSGSGKSTLLNQLGCLDTPSSGEYYLDGVSVRKMSRNDRAILRNSEKKVVIELDNVRRNFLVGEETVHALKGVSFKIYEGEFVTIMGKSGSGKSTLLNQLGCLDTPSSGEYYLDGVSVRKMSRNDRAILRNRKIGFIFQNYNLLPKTTSVENVELPLMYNPSVSAEERKQRAIESLKAVGLGERLYHKSNQMSGGQMQRVAIARALVNNPAVILADEATGNLDTRTSFEILVLFQKLYAEGRTIIFVTHNPDIANYSSRNIELRDGHIISDTYNEHILSAAEGLAALPANTDE